MMSEYLCTVCIDLTSVPKNNRIYLVLEMANNFTNSFIVFEKNKARVKIFPRETKDFNGILSKTTKGYSNVNTTLLHSVQNRNIILFDEGEARTLEENIFTTFEKSIDIAMPCVKLKYNSTEGILHRLIHGKGVKNAITHRIPRTRTYSPFFPYIQIYAIRDIDYGGIINSGLQFCIENVVQPNYRADVHSDRGGSSQSRNGEKISSLGQNSFGNPGSENSVCSPQIYTATPHYSLPDHTSSNNESILEFEQRPQHQGFADGDKRKATFTNWQHFVGFNIQALVRAGFYYTGEGTVVRCYFCGTELNDLTPRDDPLAEHERKLPSCGYLRSSLGPDYQARTQSGALRSQPANGSVVDPFQVTSRNPGSWSASDRIRSPQYQGYSLRLSTFGHWPSDISQTPEQMANAGFYYTGLQDVVRCFACDGGLKNWDPEDDPWVEHARWFRECPFVKRVKGQDFIDLVQKMTEEEDEEEDTVVHSKFQPNNEIISQVNQDDLSRLTSINIRNIQRHQYKCNDTRLYTFTRWPSDTGQTPEQMADAGFYYTGLQDIVCCFACDGRLKEWDPEDNPWTEHARWFPQCPHVVLIKGHEFIEERQIMIEQQDREEAAVVHSTFQPSDQTPSNELNSQLGRENADDVLEAEAAKHVLKQGYSRDMVAKAINELLLKGKSDYSSKDITDMITEMKEIDEHELVVEAQGTMNPSTMPGPSSQGTDCNRSHFEENQRLTQKMQCVKCKAAPKEILLLPCAHLCLCSHCSNKSFICPICYKKIREKIKTYLA